VNEGSLFEGKGRINNGDIRKKVNVKRAMILRGVGGVLISLSIAIELVGG